METAIFIDSLHKKFGQVVALNGISVEIGKGKVVGLLGRNGAGKSTLVRLLSGVMEPTTGSANLYGYDLLDNKNDVKRITGLLPEEYALYEKLTIREYISFIATLYDMEQGITNERFNNLSSRLGIEPLSDRLIETLSKGQKQKVAIIASIIHEPLIAFFDEPLANLDVQSQKVVREIILNYKNKSRVILIATHLLANVQAICDTLLIIDEGNILFSGSMEEFSEGHTTLEAAYFEYLGESV